MTETTISPTRRDIAYLQAHPEFAEKFDARFGDGAAEAALSQTSNSLLAPERGEPNRSDIEYLRANPGLAGKFDARFGEGASASFISMKGGTEPAANPNRQPRTAAVCWCRQPMQ